MLSTLQQRLKMREMLWPYACSNQHLQVAKISIAAMPCAGHDTTGHTMAWTLCVNHLSDPAIPLLSQCTFCV